MQGEYSYFFPLKNWKSSNNPPLPQSAHTLASKLCKEQRVGLTRGERERLVVCLNDKVKRIAEHPGLLEKLQVKKEVLDNVRFYTGEVSESCFDETEKMKKKMSKNVKNWLIHFFLPLPLYSR